MNQKSNEQSLYFQTVISRRNVIKDAILNFFFSCCSWPRMLLEMFIRTQFGVRYFSFSSAIIMLTVLGLYPLVSMYGFQLFARYGYGEEISTITLLKHYLTWYAFLAGFLYMAIKRREEIKRLPDVFDFDHYSKSAGLFHPRFDTLKMNGKYLDPRTIETLAEPAFFFGCGFILWLAGQSLGSLLMVCSIFYSLSYVATYKKGDDLVMDMIDERIVNEVLVKTFIDDRGAEETKGFRHYGRRPANPETRRRVAEMLTTNEEIVEVV